jgi:hypothetical protein
VDAGSVSSSSSASAHSETQLLTAAPAPRAARAAQLDALLSAAAWEAAEAEQLRDIQPPPSSGVSPSNLDLAETVALLAPPLAAQRRVDRVECGDERDGAAAAASGGGGGRRRVADLLGQRMEAT